MRSARSRMSSPSRCCTRMRIRSHERRLATRSRAFASALPGVRRRLLDRTCCPRSASTSAPRRRSARRTCGRASADTSRASRSRLEAAGLPGAERHVVRAAEPRRRADAASNGASLALSGPAGGVTGAACIARTLGIEQALTIDIGGTSADVGLVLHGEPLLEVGGAVAGVPIALPRVLVETVSAGGGSIAWVDDGGALRVGPRSAGARPGPGRVSAWRHAADRHRRAHRARQHRRDRHERRRRARCRPARSRAIDALATRIGATRRGDGRGDHRDRRRVDGARASARERRARHRSAPVRADRVRRRRTASRLRARRAARTLRAVVVPPHAGVLSALGLAIAPRAPHRRRRASCSASRRWPTPTSLASLERPRVASHVGSRERLQRRRRRALVGAGAVRRAGA